MVTPLKTARLVLRLLRPDDAPVVAQLAGRKEIADMTISIPHPYTVERAQQWIALHAHPEAGAKAIVYAITTRGEGTLIGAVGLRDIDPEHSQAEMGFWLGVEWWGKGYTTEAA